VSCVSDNVSQVPQDLVLLHGFAGTGHAWDPVIERLRGERYRPLALDLPGHGERTTDDVSIAGTVASVLNAVDGDFALCGYSMGGRIALHVALAAPRRVDRLILVATTAGIADPRERQERSRSDAQLAGFLQSATAEGFADHWMAQPIFAGTPPAAAALWREDLLRGDMQALAGVLRATGAGALRPVWDRLEALTMPATVIAGAKDTKYAQLAERLADKLPNSELKIIEGAGHGLPREAPGELAALIDAG
jgi:2-succinyl-6-hydroxy-2,4-cyclohexadiene-1-carboxylate synthase